MTKPGEQPVLTDGTITLRPWQPDDAEAVYEACQDPDIQRWTQVPHPYQRSDAAYFVAELAPAAWRDGTGVVFAVVDAADVLLGSVGLVGLDRAARTGEVGYWVAPQARRRAVASRATVLLSRWAGEAFELDRIQLFTDPENVASQAVAARAGFRLDGDGDGEHTFRGERVRMLRHIRDVIVTAG